MFSSDEIVRYRRQLQLSGWGEAGQQAVLNSRVLIIGMGGLGSIVAPYLAGAGVGQLVVADGDDIATHNLHRQWLYQETDCGQNKARVAAQRLAEINSFIDIEPLPNALSGDALVEQVALAHLVVDCTDNLSARLAVNNACRQYHKPLVTAAGIRREGLVMGFNFSHQHSPCLNCFYPPNTVPPANCNTTGVLGPVLGILGSWQAALALQYLTGQGLPHGMLWQLDLTTLQWQQLTLRGRADCSVCGQLALET